MERRANQFEAKVRQLEDRVQKYVCPIYGVRGRDGQPIGSGFLLKLSDKMLLLTAAHVLHARHDFTLEMPGQTRIVPFGGAAYWTGPHRPSAKPDFEHDIAFMVLDLEKMLEPPSIPPLRPRDLDVGDLPRSQTAYGFVGFPGSENQALPGYQFQQSTFYYGGQPSPLTKYKLLGIDPRSHFVMAFQRDRMIDREGNLTSVPEPRGMSGGPVFRLGTFPQIDGWRAHPRVIALTIEWWEKFEVLVGVRVALITEAIRQLLPEYAAELPQGVHVRANVSTASI